MQSSESSEIIYIIVVGGLVIFALAVFIFWLIMLVDAFRHASEQGMVWPILMIFCGSLIRFFYYFIVYRKRRKRYSFESQKITSLNEPPIPPGSYSVNDN
jgi:uncharacterized RDD family membrane protein YckC